ncbi:MAG: hypothetical protein KAR33_01860 [Candidatus Thorarchaeota archaeon]|nr:hypothetical protein [Candidatus Thorarchaeota archaeon]
MEKVRMDRLEWIDIILIAIFPLLGIILYFVHKNNGEEERADASLWSMLIALVIYIPLNIVLGWIGTIIAFIIIIGVYMLNQQGMLPFDSQASSKREPERVEDVAPFPNNCSNCGGSLLEKEIEWIDNNTIRCPFCSSELRVS